MPRTIAEIRRFDRDRKRRQRKANAMAGVPSPQQVNIAIVEAVAYAGASGVNIAAAKVGDQPVIVMATVLATAHRILVERLHMDAEASRVAIMKVLQPRPEHRWPSYIPSHAASSGSMPSN